MANDGTSCRPVGAVCIHVELFPAPVTVEVAHPVTEVPTPIFIAQVPPPEPPFKTPAADKAVFLYVYKCSAADPRMSSYNHLLQLTPNQQGNLNKFLTELQCRNFATKHQLSIQIGAKLAKICMQCVHIPTKFPFCIQPLVVGQELFQLLLMLVNVQCAC